MINRKSDEAIVLKKPANNVSNDIAELAEERASTKRNSSQCASSQTQSWTTTTFRLLAVRQIAIKNKDQTFNNLFSIINENLLRGSFYLLKRNSAAGCDGMTWKMYECSLSERIESLNYRLHSGKYKPKPARRVFIPKGDGTQRPLSVICLEDKIVQQALVTILNQIYEPHFLGFSYGFRPKRSQHDALDALTVALKRNRVNWVLDLDLQKFFDTIEHDWLMKFIEHRISDKKVLRIIKQWLKVGILTPNGQREKSSLGSPQGAVISPLLANIYLHYAFDLWINTLRRNYQGKVSVVRYADDAVLGFEIKEEAVHCLELMHERLGSFGLKLHPVKTKLLAFGAKTAWKAKKTKENKGSETFNFLGFTYYVGKSRKGVYMVKRKTQRTRLIKQLKRIRSELKGKRLHHKIHQTGRWLNKVVIGHLNYYSVPLNMNSVGFFILELKRAWLKALRRRSQRNKMTWERFSKYCNIFIPSPRVMHPYPEARFDARTRGRSRMR